MNWSQAFRMARAKKGVTQKVAAANMSITAPYLSNLEDDGSEKSPSHEMISTAMAYYEIESFSEFAKLGEL